MDNTFALYSLLDQIKNSFAPYSQYTFVRGLCDDLDSQMERIRTQRFRVAIVGEFKRGKSSLINTLLKREILPANVLPATATFNRIVYGDTPKALLHMKDHTVQEIPIEELENYITELTEEAYANAQKIDEVVVEFPSMFCSDHVELIDTPGLNDNEELTDLTVARLEDIDLAIVAISANFPFSDTEANLVEKLLESTSVCQIMFAVTMIDKVNDKDRDRVLDGIKKNICTKVLGKLKKDHREGDAIFEKYDSLISDPLIFGLSSMWAQQALQLQDVDLYMRSGYQKFANELPSILLSSRNTSLTDNALRVGSDSIDKFIDWLNNYPQWLEKRKWALKYFQKEFASRAYGSADLEKKTLKEIINTGMNALSSAGISKVNNIYQETWKKTPQNDRQRVTAMLSVLPFVYGEINQMLDTELKEKLTAQMKKASKESYAQVFDLRTYETQVPEKLEELNRKNEAEFFVNSLLDEQLKGIEWVDYRWLRAPLPVRYEHADNEFLGSVIAAASLSVVECLKANAEKAQAKIDLLYELRRGQMQGIVFSVFNYCSQEIEMIQKTQDELANGSVPNSLSQLRNRCRQMRNS